MGIGQATYQSSSSDVAFTVKVTTPTDNITANSNIVTVPHPTQLDCKFSRSAAYYYSSNSFTVDLETYLRASDGLRNTIKRRFYKAQDYAARDSFITIPPTGGSSTVQFYTYHFFNEDNKEDLTAVVDVLLKGRFYYFEIPNSFECDKTINYEEVVISPEITITLDAPPTFTTTQVYSSGALTPGTVANVDVAELTAQYGGDIVSAVLTIGSQTDTITEDGTLSITLDSSGYFEPTVVVTDSRGQTTTEELNPIIVRTEVPEWITPVTNRANSKTRTNATDMTRIASDCAYLGGANEVIEYSSSDIVRSDEWDRIITFAQTLNATITSGTDYINLNKIEQAFLDAYEDL